MKSLIFTKKQKPYILSKNLEDTLLFNESYGYEIGEKLLLSNDDRYMYYAKNPGIIGEADLEVREFNLDEMSYEEKEQLKLNSGLSFLEIRKKLKNRNIGQALYFKNITLYKKTKESTEVVEMKRDKFLKMNVEREVYYPLRDKKVFYKGELTTKNPKYLISLTSQEAFDVIEENISLIIRNKFKI